MYNITMRETYYMYDRQDNKMYRFSSKAKLFLTIAKWYNIFNVKLLHDISNNQNFSGHDTTHCVKFTTSIDENGYSHYGTEHHYNERRFTFYRQINDNKPTIIDITPYLNDIHDTVHTLWKLRHSKNKYNWCHEKRHQAYQVRNHGFRPDDKYKLDFEENDYIRPTSRRKKGLNKIHKYHYYASSGEKSWKTQTKDKHQHGNNTRNKHLESYLTSMWLDDILEMNDEAA